MKKPVFRLTVGMLSLFFLLFTLLSCKKAEKTVASPAASISSPASTGPDSGSPYVFVPYFASHTVSEGELGTVCYERDQSGPLYYAIFHPQTGVKAIDDTLNCFLRSLVTGFSDKAKASGNTMELNLDYISVSAGSSLANIRFFGFLSHMGKEKTEENISYAFLFDKTAGKALCLTDIFTAEGIGTIRTLLSESLTNKTKISVPTSFLTDAALLNALQFSSEGAVFLFHEGSLSQGIPEVSQTIPYEALLGTFTESFRTLVSDLLPKEGKIDPNKPMIALTFDDGPNKSITPKLLELLKQYGVHATFCVVGRRIAKNEDIIKSIVADGNDIANHTWEHARLTDLTPEAAKESLEKTNQAVYDLTGYTVRFIRPSYGSMNSDVREIAKELDMSLICWSIDSEDWKTKDAQAIFNMCSSHTADGAIILCHDMYESTYEAMKLLIPYLIEQGYQIVSLSELFEYSDTLAVSGEAYRHA